MPPKPAAKRPVFICSNEDCEKREFPLECYLRSHLYHDVENHYVARVRLCDQPPCKGPKQQEIDEYYRFPYSANPCDEPDCAHIAQTPTHLKAHRNFHDSGLLDDPKYMGGFNFAPCLYPCQTAPVVEGQVQDPCFDGTNQYIRVQANRSSGAEGFRAIVKKEVEEKIDEHMAECHPDLPGDLACSFVGCNETFHTQSAFVAHAAAAHRNVVFKCPDPDCGEVWKTDEMMKDAGKLVGKIFTHIKEEHTRVECTHCEYSIAANFSARRDMIRDHFSYKNLVEDADFSNRHGLTDEDRDRCIEIRGEYPNFVDELFAQSVVTSFSRAWMSVQKLANLCDHIRIYRDYKDGYKSVKGLSDAIEAQTGRREITYHHSDKSIIVPNRQGRGRRAQAQVQPPRIDQKNEDAALNDENENQIQQQQQQQESSSLSSSSSSSDSSDFDDDSSYDSNRSWTSKDSSTSSSSSSSSSSFSSTSDNNIDKKKKKPSDDPQNPNWLLLGTSDFRAAFARAELRRREKAEKLAQLANERKMRNKGKTRNDDDYEYGSSGSDEDGDDSEEEGEGYEKEEYYKESKILHSVNQFNDNNNKNTSNQKQQQQSKKITSQDWKFPGMVRGRSSGFLRDYNENYLGGNNTKTEDAPICPQVDNLGNSCYLTQNEINWFLNQSQSAELSGTAKKLVENQHELARLKNNNIYTSVKPSGYNQKINSLEAEIRRGLCFLLQFNETLTQNRVKEAINNFMSKNEVHLEIYRPGRGGTVLKPSFFQLRYLIPNEQNPNNNNNSNNPDAAVSSSSSSSRRDVSSLRVHETFKLPHPSTLILHPEATDITVAAETFRELIFFWTIREKLPRGVIKKDPDASDDSVHQKRVGLVINALPHHHQDAAREGVALPQTDLTVMRMSGNVYDYNHSPFQMAPHESLLNVVLRSAAFDPDCLQEGDDPDPWRCRYCQISHDRPLQCLKLLAGVSNYERLRRTNQIATIRGETVTPSMLQRELMKKHELKSPMDLLRGKVLCDRMIEKHFSVEYSFECDRKNFIDRAMSRIEIPRRLRLCIEEVEYTVCLEEITRDKEEIEKFLKIVDEEGNDNNRNDDVALSSPSLIAYEQVTNSTTEEIFYRNRQDGFLYNVVHDPITSDDEDNASSEDLENTTIKIKTRRVLKKFSPFVTHQQYHVTHSFATTLLHNNFNRFIIALNWQELNTPRARNIFYFCIKLHRFAFPGYVVDYMANFPRLFPSETSVDQIEICMMSIMREHHPLWCEFSPELRFRTFCGMDAIDCLRPLLKHNVESTVFIFCILSVWLRDKLNQCSTLWPELVDPSTGLPHDDAFGAKLDELVEHDPDGCFITNDEDHEAQRARERCLDEEAAARTYANPLELLRHFKIDSMDEWYSRHREIDFGSILDSQFAKWEAVVPEGLRYDPRMHCSKIPLYPPEFYHQHHELLLQQLQQQNNDKNNTNNDPDASTTTAVPSSADQFFSPPNIDFITEKDPAIFKLPVPPHQANPPYYFSPFFVCRKDADLYPLGVHHDAELYPRGYPVVSEPSWVYPVVTSKRSRVQEYHTHIFTKNKRAAESLFEATPEQVQEHLQLISQQIFNGKRSNGVGIIRHVPYSFFDRYSEKNAAVSTSALFFDGKWHYPTESASAFSDEELALLGVPVAKNRMDGFEEPDSIAGLIEFAREESTARYEKVNATAITRTERCIANGKVPPSSRSTSICVTTSCSPSLSPPSRFVSASPSPSPSSARTDEDDDADGKTNSNNNRFTSSSSPSPSSSSSTRSPSVTPRVAHFLRNKRPTQQFQHHNYYQDDKDNSDFDLFGITEANLPRFEELIEMRYLIRTNTDHRRNSWSPFSKFYYDFLDIDPLYAWSTAYASRRSFINNHRDRSSVLLRVVLHEFMANLPRDMHERFYRILRAAPGASVDIEKYRDLINFVPVSTAADDDDDVIGCNAKNNNNNGDDDNSATHHRHHQKEERPLKIVPFVWPDFDTRPIDWKGHSLRVFAHVMTQNIDNWHGMNPVEDQINEKFLESYFQGMCYGKLFQGFTNNDDDDDDSPNNKKKNDAKFSSSQDASTTKNNNNNNTHHQDSSSSSKKQQQQHDDDDDNIPSSDARNDLPASVMMKSFNGMEFEHRSMPFDYLHANAINNNNTKDKINVRVEMMTNLFFDRYVNRFRNSGMGDYVPTEYELSNEQLELKKKQLRLQQKKKNQNINHNNNNHNNDDDAAAVAVASSNTNNNNNENEIKITHADYRPRHKNHSFFQEEEREQKKFYLERGLQLANNPHYYEKKLVLRHDFSKSIFSDEVRGLTTIYQRQKQQQKQKQQIIVINGSSSKNKNEPSSSKVQQD